MSKRFYHPDSAKYKILEVLEERESALTASEVHELLGESTARMTTYNALCALRVVGAVKVVGLKPGKDKRMAAAYELVK